MARKSKRSGRSAGAWIALGALAAIALGERESAVGDSEPRQREAVESPLLAARKTAIEGWIADLADDEVRGNAMAARQHLRAVGSAARPELERALHSIDHQQRQLAASLLRALPHAPSDRLLAVCIEGLHHDRLPADPEFGLAFLSLPNAREGAAYLIAHAARVELRLLGGLQSLDGQARLLCAYVLAAGRRTRGLARTTRILIDHLQDNDVPGDAVLASAALYQLGEIGLPYLRQSMPYADEQALSLLRLIELDIRHPPESTADLVRRREMHTATNGLADPAVQCSIRTPGLVQWGDALSHDVGFVPRTGTVR